MTLRDASTFTFNAHHLENVWHSILKATKITIRLNFVFTTFGPIAMFKEQSLSFHVVYKTFITQNYLFDIPSNILYFSWLYHSYLTF